MPKVERKSSQKIHDWITEFGENVFTSDGSVLMCKLCEKTVNPEKRYFVIQHMQTAKHKKAENQTKCTQKQVNLLTNFVVESTRKSQFSMDLCKAFISADIPLWKLENPILREFLKKYTNEQIPNESTLRKSYVADIYSIVMQNIRDEVKEKNIWISIDETTDAIGRYVGHVIIGTMEVSKPSKIFLLASDVLDKVNNSTIAQLFTNSLLLLWPNGIHYSNVLLFVTDAAPYMKKAAEGLKVLFPKMLHLTCLAHALHRISEEVRRLFPEVDKIISNGKKVFIKSPSRIQIFKEMAPDLSLPPQPILTRWGTWIAATLYYCNNFDTVKHIINSLNEEDASSIGILKNVMEKASVQNDLAFIASSFSNIPSTITALEQQNLSLVNALQLFTNIVGEIDQVSGDKGSLIKQKLSKIISKNGDLTKLKKIAAVLEGNNNSGVEMNPNTIACFKYAPITSVDVERSFSLLKNLLSDKRQNLSFDNMKKLLIVMCNSK